MHWRTARQLSGGNQLPGLHISAGGRAESNSLARHIPPLVERNLAVVRDSSFIHQRELNPVEPLDPRIDHREFAVLIFVGFFFGGLFTVAAVVMALT